MEKLGEIVWQSHVPSKTLPPYQFTECYWIGNEREVILIDTGDGHVAAQSTLEGDWEGLGAPRVQAIYVTHYHGDHSGGGVWASERWQAPLYIGAHDLGYLDEKTRASWQIIPRSYVDIVGIRVDVVPAPGHTCGQVNFWIPTERILLAGDNVLGNTTSVIVPPDGNMAKYLTTLQILRQLGAEIIGPGHGEVVRNPDQYLAYYQTHRQQRNDQILALLDQGVTDPRSIAEQIYGDVLAPREMELGEWMVRGHLAWCVDIGLAIDDGGRFRKV
ncbi:MAG: MBL fold metallo-hydrolase [Sulfobacillus acidophilus]|uniref:MBL fold metallo-hydrolase n=1 Tax=Sulfobacillus acidophilus TaxID=53633 RepID=A0A2T2WKX8_9FIRM|nr:MAG: MBL fold metallo-hydrolase [Sulfobacillus acidophilus]